jgi:hypothetical protein
VRYQRRVRVWCCRSAEGCRRAVEAPGDTEAHRMCTRAHADRGGRRTARTDADGPCTCTGNGAGTGTGRADCARRRSEYHSRDRQCERTAARLTHVATVQARPRCTTAQVQRRCRELEAVAGMYRTLTGMTIAVASADSRRFRVESSVASEGAAAGMHAFVCVRACVRVGVWVRQDGSISTGVLFYLQTCHSS